MGEDSTSSAQLCCAEFSPPSASSSSGCAEPDVTQQMGPGMDINSTVPIKPVMPRQCMLLGLKFCPGHTANLTVHKICKAEALRSCSGPKAQPLPGWV